MVGTADDAEQAEQLILRRRPDVALVDLALPGENGADRISRGFCAPVRVTSWVVFLSRQSTPQNHSKLPGKKFR